MCVQPDDGKRHRWWTAQLTFLGDTWVLEQLSLQWEALKKHCKRLGRVSSCEILAMCSCKVFITI